MCIIIYKDLWIHIFAECFYGVGCHGNGGNLVCLGTGDAPHKPVSSMVKICLHFMVKYYDDAFF